MAKKKLQKSETQIQYEKQLKRIKQFVHRAEKRGYSFPENIVPQKLKRPTKKSVEKLARLTPEYFYKKAEYSGLLTGYDSDKGEFKKVSGLEGRKLEKERAVRLAKHTKWEKKHAKELQKFIKEEEKKERELEKERKANEREAKLKAEQAEQERARKAQEKIDNYEREFAYQLDRIEDLIDNLKSEAKDRGYILPKDFLDKILRYARDLKNSKAEIAGNYDEIINQLESITEESILSSEGVIFKDPRTGTAFKGHEGLKIEAYREEQQRGHELSYDTEVSETDNVLNVIRDYIDNWSPSSLWTDWFANTKEKDKNLLERILDSAIALEGEEAVAQRLQENADEVLEIAYGVIYDSGGKEGRGGINADLVRFTAIIMGRPLTQHESEVITQASEANELE